MSPTPTFISDFFQMIFWIAGGLGGVLGCIVLIIQIAKANKRTPSIEAEFATKGEVKDLSGKISKIEKDVGEKVDGLRQDVGNKVDGLRQDLQVMYKSIERSDEARTSGIHVRLNDIAETSATMSGQLTEHLKQDSIAEHVAILCDSVTKFINKDVPK